jgi:hypothetical protein
MQSNQEQEPPVALQDAIKALLLPVFLRLALLA